MTLTRPQLDAIYNAYLVTGDKNMLNATLTINYQIDDAAEYLLGVATSQTLQSGEASVELAARTPLELLLRHVCFARADPRHGHHARR